MLTSFVASMTKPLPTQIAGLGGSRGRPSSLPFMYSFTPGKCRPKLSGWGLAFSNCGREAGLRSLQTAQIRDITSDQIEPRLVGYLSHPLSIDPTTHSPAETRQKISGQKKGELILCSVVMKH